MFATSAGESFSALALGMVEFGFVFFGSLIFPAIWAALNFLPTWLRSGFGGLPFGCPSVEWQPAHPTRVNIAFPLAGSGLCAAETRAGSATAVATPSAVSVWRS